EKSGVKTTVHVEGMVSFGDWDKLWTLCLDTLKSVDHLALNLERLGNYDYIAGSFVCLLKKIAQQQGKRLLVLGAPDDSFVCEYRSVVECQSRRCPIAVTNRCCVWNNLLG